jgi:hypothetical protein
MNSLVILIVSALLGTNAPAANPDAATPQLRSTAVNVIRLINTAENMEYRKNGKYLSWTELAKTASFQKAKEVLAKHTDFTSANLSGEGAVVPGLALKMSISNEGKSYLLSLGPEDRHSCDSYFFTSELGLIQEGWTLDCKTK